VQAILVSGIPGAGKTTVSRLLARRLPKAVHIEGDVLSFEFVVSGLPLPEDDAEWSALMDLRRRQICWLADSYADAGFVPVIDDVVTHPSVLALYEQHLQLRPMSFVALVPDLDVVRSRDAARDKHVFEAWAHLDTELRHTLRGRGLHIDSSSLSAEATVDQILERLPEAVILR
jgi:predicted kinase